MIKDFFSHKIHSSGNDWSDKLVELAHIFHEFDGQPYNRNAIEQRLTQISPRSSYVARDASKFRDEYSAYPAYFGIYHLHPSENGWVMSTTETSKQLLIREEPNVAAFLQLQLALFQYPNGMGAAYYAGSNKLRLQANSASRILDHISKGIHLCPLRLIVSMLLSDASLRQVELLESTITYDEIFALANHPEINRVASPPIGLTKSCLDLARAGKLNPPHRYESRFHLLKHLELFKIGNGKIGIRDSVNLTDKLDVESKVRALGQINVQFTDFDQIKTKAGLEEAISSGKWANYFDGIKTIPPEIVTILTADVLDEIESGSLITPTEIVIQPKVYPLQRRDQVPSKPVRYTRQRELVDPEVTRIRRQRRNLIHKIIVEQMDSLLRARGAEPFESQHIDLYAQIPNNGAFIFEMKSGGKNLLAQIRKGLSQLYEYRFRYRSTLPDSTILCLVLAEKPTSLPWVEEYLCVDREIALCWFESTGELNYSRYCAEDLAHLVR